MKAKFIFAILVLLCASLNCTFGGKVAPPTRAVSQPETEATKAAIDIATSTSPPLPTPTSEATVPPTPIVITGDEPVVLNEFLLDQKYFGFSRIAFTAGKLWITTITGHLLVYDTNGQMLKEIQLAEKPSQYFKGWLAYDDNYVWAMISTKEGRDDQGVCYLYRIRIDDFEALPVELPEEVKDFIGRPINPFWMGLAAKPGEVWVGGIDHLLIYDADNPQNVRDVQDQWTIHNLMWDGEYMWGSMTYCAPQEFLMPIDPDYESDEPCMRPRVAVDVDWMFRYKEMIWVGSLDQLFAYNADRVTTSTYDDPAYPEIEAPFREEHNLFVNPIYDGRYVWDINLGWADIYAYDPEADMQEAGQFSFLQEGEDGTVFDITFDGRFLWGLKFTEDAEYHLVQVGLPWAQ